MRVISGKYKGRKLVASSDNSVRPTTDRIKETIFNILLSRGYPYGCRVLDLFAGSGALGIEALSRGASEVVFCDVSPFSVKVINKNLSGITEKFFVIRADYKQALLKLNGKFDLVFLDPPYDLNVIEDAINLMHQNGLLAPNALILAEQNSKNSLINLDESYIIESRRFGNTTVSFINKRS